MTMSDGDSEEEESFHFLGTPLDPITEDDKHEDAYSRRRPRPVPVHEQRVLDERGRPLRFHGAFQGGFSAGHFNTVADPEGRGFTPAVFVSRRQRKKDGGSAPKRARPEDFMDSEDFTEFGIAPRTFHTAADFENTAARSTSDIVMDIVCPIRPIKSSIAIRLMRRFGWREGQSVGAVKNRPKTEMEAEADEEAESALLAADAASSQIAFVPKTNTFGLGYSGIDPRTALFGGGPQAEKARTREVLLGQRGQRGIRGQAFGVSVLEDDDDDDIYGQPNLKDYDWEIGGPVGEEDERKRADLHGWTAPKDRNSPQKKPLGYVGKVLKGFRVGRPLDRSSSSRFPAPFLPAWFVPIRGANKGLLQEPGDPEQAAGDEASSASGPGASVFDFISREDRVRLELARRKAAPKPEPRPPEVGAKEATAKGAVLSDLRAPDRKKEKASGASRWSRWDSKPSASPSPPPPPPPPHSAPAPPAVKSEPAEAGSALGAENRQPLTINFRPFAKDKEKQARFELFCRAPLMQQQPKEAYAALAPAHFTEWEAQREEEEFAKAARIYRPLSSMLSSRFHRGEDIQLDETTGALKSIPLPAEKKERTAREVAAAEKRFGPETRRSLRWHPHSLLCRRFNVPEPFPGCEVVGLEGARPRRKDAFSILDLVGGGGVADSTASAAIEAPPVMTREEVQRKRKSVFSCLFEDSTPSTSSCNEARISSPGETANASSDISRPLEQSAVSENKDKEEKESASFIQPTLVAQTVPQMSQESPSETEPSSPPVPPQDSDSTKEEKEEQRIPIDIFKAIFADSEESEEEEEEEKEKEEEDVKPIKEKKTVAPSHAMAASSLFRHLFEDEKVTTAQTRGKNGTPPRSEEVSMKSDKGSLLAPATSELREMDSQPAGPSREKSFGAALPPNLPSGAPAKELSSNEFLLRLAAGELSEKVKKVKKKKEKHAKRSKTSKASKKSKKKKKKHKKNDSSSSEES